MRPIDLSVVAVVRTADEGADAVAVPVAVALVLHAGVVRVAAGVASDAEGSLEQDHK